MLNSCVLGSFASLLQSTDAIAEQAKAKMDRVNVYLREHNVAADLANDVRQYYLYSWSRQVHDEEGTIFEDLSDSLRMKLTIAVKRQFIMSCELFKHLDPECIVSLVKRLRRHICVPEEAIFFQGDLGETMYFLSRGNVAIRLQDEGTTRLLTTLRSGAVFGEMAVMSDDDDNDKRVRTASATALTFTQLQTLSRDDFWEVAEKHALFVDEVRAASAKLVRKTGIFKKISSATRKCSAINTFSRDSASDTPGVHSSFSALPAGLQE